MLFISKPMRSGEVSLVRAGGHVLPCSIPDFSLSFLACLSYCSLLGLGTPAKASTKFTADYFFPYFSAMENETQPPLFSPSV